MLRIRYSPAAAASAPQRLCRRSICSTIPSSSKPHRRLRFASFANSPATRTSASAMRTSSLWGGFRKQTRCQVVVLHRSQLVCFRKPPQSELVRIADALVRVAGLFAKEAKRKRLCGFEEDGIVEQIERLQRRCGALAAAAGE